MVFFLKLMNLQFNMKLCRKIFCTICTGLSRWMRIKSVHNIEMESIWNCASQPALQADPNLCMACSFFLLHWMRVDVVVFLRTLAFVQINDDWINERSKRPESKNKNKSIARIHTICALCNAPCSWVFYHLLKIIYIFISAIFFTRAFFFFLSLDRSFSSWFRRTYFLFSHFYFFSLWVESFLLQYVTLNTFFFSRKN